jgi:hypothetical protein
LDNQQFADSAKPTPITKKKHQKENKNEILRLLQYRK